MQYDKSSGVSSRPAPGTASRASVRSRRAVLTGAVGAGAAGVWALVAGLPAGGHDPTGGRALRGAAAPGRAPGTSARAAAAPAAAARPPAHRTRAFAGAARGRTGAAGTRPPTFVRERAHRTLPRPGRRIALTFDDGPHPVHTPAILRVLRRYGAQATFFVLGECAARHRDLVRRIAEDGHVVANHTWSHPDLTRLAPAGVRDELGRTSELIHRTLGVPPHLARAPYGAWDRASLRVCAGLGMEPVGWSVDTADWQRPGVDAIRSRVLRSADSGAIVLAHDGGGERTQTARSLEQYLPRLLDRGFAVVPVEMAL
ncbi:polysaccharide deacetylase family protein [Streptomyces sp. HNM0574]|uniref:polysaccharide deacetylase family protein n=1 Tax=Streptomyces sp. HNM0574 TaxID=2714954 RepID=UPI00146CC12E|nr:polysaccharide deacetylase family protein [Streptomyces sp. HNM0574]NLU70141.1 polysaccharide deacetylase family protein [Streptomyces sp. HNM0574]